MKKIVFFLLLLPLASYAQLKISSVVGDTLLHGFSFNELHTNAYILNATNAFQNEHTIPRDLYTQQLPFFCRQELKMQKAHVPLTFRLGTMDQCNYLEQKPGYKIN